MEHFSNFVHAHQVWFIAGGALTVVGGAAVWIYNDLKKFGRHLSQLS